jgi:hypothetical protein
METAATLAAILTAKYWQSPAAIPAITWKPRRREPKWDVISAAGGQYMQRRWRPIQKLSPQASSGTKTTESIMDEERNGDTFGWEMLVLKARVDSWRPGELCHQVRETELPQKLRLWKPTDITVLWKALEEHFLMVLLVYRFKHFRGMHCLNLSKTSVLKVLTIRDDWMRGYAPLW